MTDALGPYPAYTDSRSPWLGRVPSHWQVRRLRHVAELRVSNIDKHTKPGELPVRLCNYVDVYKHERITDRIPFMRATAGADEIERFRLHPGDVVITKDSESWTDIGVPTLVEYTAPDLVCGYHLAILRPRPDRLAGGFLLRALQSQLLAAQFHVGAVGITRYGLSHADIKDAVIPLPPPDEQRLIVRFLAHATARVERLMRAKRRLVGLLAEQKQAIIQRAVTGGLDPNAERVPSGVPWLGDIPAGWQVRPLKAVAAIQSGITLGKDYTGCELASFPYLRVANVQAGRLNLKSVKMVAVPAEEVKRSTLRTGDVLMTEGGDPDKLGRGCIWSGEIATCLHQNHVFALRTNPSELSSEFLVTLLSMDYARTYFIRTAKQTTNLASTNRTTIGQLRVVLPPLAEQREILHRLRHDLSTVDSTIQRAEREITLLREYRTTLTAAVVMGQLDVRAVAARLPEAVAPAADPDPPADDADDPDGERPV